VEYSFSCNTKNGILLQVLFYPARPARKKHHVNPDQDFMSRILSALQASTAMLLGLKETDSQLGSQSIGAGVHHPQSAGIIYALASA